MSILIRELLIQSAKHKRLIRRYIVAFHDLETLDRIERELRSYPEGTYLVGYFERNAIPMMLNFALLDKEELTVGVERSQVDLPHGSLDLVTKNPVVVGVFNAYFETLWRDCIKLNPDEVKYDVLQRIRRELDGMVQRSGDSSQS